MNTKQQFCHSRECGNSAALPIKISMLFCFLSGLLCSPMAFGKCYLSTNDIDLGKMSHATSVSSQPMIYGKVSVICDGNPSFRPPETFCIGITKGNSQSYNRYLLNEKKSGKRMGYALLKPPHYSSIWGDDPGDFGNRYCPGAVQKDCRGSADCEYTVAAKFVDSDLSRHAGKYFDSTVHVNLYDSPTSDVADTKNLSLSGAQNGTCLVTVSNVLFPDYDPSETTYDDIYRGAPIQVECTEGQSYTVGVTCNGGACTAPARTLTRNGGSDSLTWYLNPPSRCGSDSPADVWGNIGQTPTFYNFTAGVGTGMGSKQDVHVCAWIRHGQTAQNGATYSSIETVTVSY